VVEASISDISYMESINFPSEGRYFIIRLSNATRVDNVKDKKVEGAKVILSDSEGASWQYVEDRMDPGVYYLRDDHFKAEVGLSYQLLIVLETGDKFESSWEAMPSTKNEIDEVIFDEINKEEHIWEAGERVIKNLTGVNVNIVVPQSEDQANRFYKWSFDPLWMYKAELTDFDSPVRYCWVTDRYTLKDFRLQQDIGSVTSNKELFFIRTKGNEKILQYFSTLIHQEIMSQAYYSFWVDFQDQKEKGGLFDKSPYGLPNNINAVINDLTVNGYFGVVSQETKRWEFPLDQLSYNVPNNTRDQCKEISDFNDQCVNYLLYNMRTPVNTPPRWWTKELF